MTSVNSFNYPKELCGKLWALVTHGALCDVIINVADHNAGAHRIILAASSPLLCSFFMSETLKDKDIFRISLTDKFSEKACLLVLEYIYTGKLPQEQTELSEFLPLATYWQISLPMLNMLGVSEMVPVTATASSETPEPSNITRGKEKVKRIKDQLPSERDGIVLHENCPSVHGAEITKPIGRRSGRLRKPTSKALENQCRLKETKRTLEKENLSSANRAEKKATTESTRNTRKSNLGVAVRQYQVVLNDSGADTKQVRAVNEEEHSELVGSIDETFQVDNEEDSLIGETSPLITLESTAANNQTEKEPACDDTQMCNKNVLNETNAKTVSNSKSKDDANSSLTTHTYRITSKNNANTKDTASSEVESSLKSISSAHEMILSILQSSENTSTGTAECSPEAMTTTKPCRNIELASQEVAIIVLEGTSKVPAKKKTTSRAIPNPCTLNPHERLMKTLEIGNKGNSGTVLKMPANSDFHMDKLTISEFEMANAVNNPQNERIEACTNSKTPQHSKPDSASIANQPSVTSPVIESLKDKVVTGGGVDYAIKVIPSCPHSDKTPDCDAYAITVVSVAKKGTESELKHLPIEKSDAKIRSDLLDPVLVNTFHKHNIVPPLLAHVFTDHCYYVGVRAQFEAWSERVVEDTIHIRKRLKAKKDLELHRKRMIAKALKTEREKRQNDTNNDQHHNNEPVICPLCGRTFASQKKYTIHRNYTHVKEDNLHCEICGFRFRKRNMLLAHNLEKHFREGMEMPITYNCKFSSCNFSTYRQKMLYYHQKMHDIKDGKLGRLVCEHCGKSFMHKKSYSTHLKLHLPKQEYTCEFCTKAYSRKLSLQIHLRTHHLIGRTRMKCELCDYFCYNQSDIDMHLYKTHNIFTEGHKGFKTEQVQGVESRVMCHVCGKTYTGKVGLIHHKCQIRTKPRSENPRYKQCPYCNFFGGNHHQHFNSMHKDKRLRCDDCPFTCFSPARMDFHGHKMHGKPRDPTIPSGRRRTKPRSTPTGPKQKEWCMCEICGKVVTKGGSFWGHMKTHKEGRAVRAVRAPQTFKPKTQCTVCGKLVQHMGTHMLVHRVQQVCPTCGVRVKNLRQHILHIHQSMGKQACPTCGVMVKNLVLHIRRNHENHPLLACDMCEKEFKTRAGLNDHKLSHDESEKRVCSTCGMEIFGDKKMNLHMRRHALDPTYKKPVECATCGIKTKSKTGMFIHILRRHGKTEDDRCPYCPFTTREFGAMKNHILIYHGEERFHCKTCTFSCHFKVDLNRHVRKMHPKTLPIKQVSETTTCKLCGKTVALQSLQRHTKMCIVDPVLCQSCTCDICGFTCKGKNTMNLHMYHHKEGEDKCPFCDYTVKQVGGIKKHIQAYHTKNNYHCPSCPFACVFRIDYIKHKRKHHSEQVATDDSESQQPVVFDDPSTVSIVDVSTTIEPAVDLQGRYAGSSKTRESFPVRRGRLAVNTAKRKGLTRSHAPSAATGSGLQTTGSNLHTVSGSQISATGSRVQIIGSRVQTSPSAPGNSRSYLQYQNATLAETDRETQTAIDQIIYETMGIPPGEQTIRLQQDPNQWDMMTVVTEALQ